MLALEASVLLTFISPSISSNASRPNSSAYRLISKRTENAQTTMKPSETVQLHQISRPECRKSSVNMDKPKYTKLLVGSIGPTAQD